MQCPKCLSDMEVVTFKTIEIERCTSCKGLWFDMLKHEDLKKLSGSEVIDTGDPEIGKVYNKIDRINCPKCSTEMIRMADRHQHHIWYEGCHQCYGVFFDAGEFTDYKEETIMDYIKDLITPERK